jgi:hypothetical protein
MQQLALHSNRQAFEFFDLSSAFVHFFSAFLAPCAALDSPLAEPCRILKLWGV